MRDNGCTRSSTSSANARGELIRSCTVRSWRRRIRLCGRFPYRPTIGGACGMYRPPVGPVSAIERAMRMPGFSGLASADFGFLHTARAVPPRLFFARYARKRNVREGASLCRTARPTSQSARSRGARRAKGIPKPQIHCGIRAKPSDICASKQRRNISRLAQGRRRCGSQSNSDKGCEAGEARSAAGLGE